MSAVAKEGSKIEELIKVVNLEQGKRTAYLLFIIKNN